ncbi:MAG TPA: penicillin acylase family protein, partial [Anaerolineae bacterium]
ARGKLATVYGRDAAPNDYMVHLLRIWDVVDGKYDTIPLETRAVMEAYADGLNHYAALHEDEALPGLFPISGKDVAAGFVHKVPLFFGLDRTLAELFAEQRPSPISHLQSPISTYGSNALAVGPTRSENGETFLAVNSHQPWEGPVAWYEAHLHSDEGWDMVGGLLPGAPTIIHGHNRDLGWAFTVNSPDLIDVYVLDVNPDNPDQYRFDGQWRELEVRQAPIAVKVLGRFQWTVTEEVLRSVYGPVVRRDHGTYAIRFAGLGEIGHVEQLYRMNKATTLEEWQAAVSDGSLPMFNIGYADREGNVYYVYNGLLPLRAAGYDWEQSLPGDTSATLWTEYLPFDQRPQVLNPPSGFIQNCNSSPFQTTAGPGNPNPANFSPTLGIETHMSNRALRARALFGADESITEWEFYAYKYDPTYALESDVFRFVEMIVDAPASRNPDVQAAREVLGRWDLQTNPESTGATLAILTLHYLHESEQVEITPSRLVGNEVELDALEAAFAKAVGTLMLHFGRVEVPWGEMNRLQRGELDLPLWGGPDVLNAVYGELQENGRFRGFVGDSYVLLVTWDAEGNVHSRSIHQYGSATLDEESSHYNDQALHFARRELKPVWMDEAAIRANLEAEYRAGEEDD